MTLPGQSDGGRLPRATCPTCFREVALRRGGELREHRDIGGSEICVASGYTVAQVEQRIAGEIEALRQMGR